MRIHLKNIPAEFKPDPIWDDGALSPVHTGDYSRRFRRQSPFSATVSEFGDYSRQCGQGFTGLTHAQQTCTRNLHRSELIEGSSIRYLSFLHNFFERMCVVRHPYIIGFFEEVRPIRKKMSSDSASFQFLIHQ